LKGQESNWVFSHGPEAIRVTLETWGPKDFEIPMLNALMANWGGDTDNPPNYGKEGMTVDQVAYLGRCFNGGTLQQILEGITFWFKIDGISRATTHQLVRTRVGAAFMQHGGRDNDWRNRDWTMPETIRRVIASPEDERVQGLKHCLTDWNPIQEYLERFGCGGSLYEALYDVINRAHDLYAALVDAGIPWQDARRLLPMGTQTYIFAQYNYLALRGLLANRLESDMDWEINCVAQLMVRELRMHCPELIWQPLQSASDKAGVDLHSLMSSWTPIDKHPSLPGALDMSRAHRPEQNPFWILAPESLNGGDVRWIPTNGHWVEEPFIE
jgi:flavin-dependent thymidylate synthase